MNFKGADLTVCPSSFICNSPDPRPGRRRYQLYDTGLTEKFPYRAAILFAIIPSFYAIDGCKIRQVLI